MARRNEIVAEGVSISVIHICTCFTKGPRFCQLSDLCVCGNSCIALCRDVGTVGAALRRGNHDAAGD